MLGCGRHCSRTVRADHALNAVATAPVLYRVGRYRNGPRCLDAVATAPVLYRVAAMLGCGRYRTGAMLGCGRYRSRTAPSGGGVDSVATS